jgi:hypothetical protein
VGEVAAEDGEVLEEVALDGEAGVAEQAVADELSSYDARRRRGRHGRDGRGELRRPVELHGEGEVGVRRGLHGAVDQRLVEVEDEAEGRDAGGGGAAGAGGEGLGAGGPAWREGAAVGGEALDEEVRVEVLLAVVVVVVVADPSSFDGYVNW